MDALNRAGIATQIIPLNTDIDYDKFTSFQFYGAYPFNLETVYKKLKEDGKKIVYDMDDALTLIEEKNPFYHAVMKDVWSVKQSLEYADEVTVSTPKMGEYVKGLGYTGKITVVPNCYNPADWITLPPEHEGIRIGFAGASPHVPDLIKVLPAVKNIQKKYNAKFVIMGLGLYDYKTWFKQYRYIATDEATKYLYELDRLLSDMEYEWIPFVDYEKYPETLINLSLDFGLCPLQDTPFNHHRSAVKALEYSLAGALPLAQNITPYNNDFSSVLTMDHQWEDKLEFCIQNPKEVAETKKMHMEWIKENRNVDKQIDLLKSIYG